MKVVNYNIPNYQEVSGKGEEVIREFKGLNSYDPLSIPSNFFTDLQNLDFDDYPTLSTRKGFEWIHTSTHKAIGVGVWKGIELHVIRENGVWESYNGTTWKEIKTLMDSSAPYSFTNFQGNLSDINLFICNGSSGLYKYDGTTASTYGDAPSDINFITTYQNRLWGASSGNQIHACALDDAQHWQQFNGDQSDSFFKTIESERGESITMLNGGLSKLVIGMNNSVRELYGGLPQDFSDRIVSEEVGFISNSTNTTHNGTLYGIHDTGIYSYSGGTLPNKNEYDIVSKFDFNLKNSVCAINYNNDILFSIDNNILLLDKKTYVNSWTLFNGINAEFFGNMKNELYITSGIYTFKWKGDNDNSSPINYSLTTKVFNNNSIANKQRLYKVYITAVITSGSVMRIHLSNSIEGNDWELVNTVVGSGSEVKRILVPVGKFALENFIRLKIEGSGYIKLYEINRQFRTLPLV